MGGDASSVLPRTIKTMLFADVEGFSRLDESKTPYFVEKFPGGISSIIERLSVHPAFVNTWGDSFFAVFDKLEAKLAHAMLSIPASKGFEIGSGFECCEKKGSEHNDLWVKKNDKFITESNNAGGINGGVSNGMDIEFSIAFKAPSTISKPQKTCNINGDEVLLQAKGRHDPCIVNRAIPIIEAMSAVSSPQI